MPFLLINILSLQKFGEIQDVHHPSQISNENEASPLLLRHLQLILVPVLLEPHNFFREVRLLLLLLTLVHQKLLLQSLGVPDYPSRVFAQNRHCRNRVEDVVAAVHHSQEAPVPLPSGFQAPQGNCSVALPAH